MKLLVDLCHDRTDVQAGALKFCGAVPGVFCLRHVPAIVLGQNLYSLSQLDQIPTAREFGARQVDADILDWPADRAQDFGACV